MKNKIKSNNFLVLALMLIFFPNLNCMLKKTSQLLVKSNTKNFKLLSEVLKQFSYNKKFSSIKKPEESTTKIISEIESRYHTKANSRYSSKSDTNLLLLTLEFNKESNSLNKEKELSKLRKKLSKLIKATKSNDLNKIEESQYDFKEAALAYIYNFNEKPSQHKTPGLHDMNLKQLSDHIHLLDTTLCVAKTLEQIKEEKVKTLSDKIDKK